MYMESRVSCYCNVFMKGMSANRVQDSNKSGKRYYIFYLQIINLEYDEGLV